MPVTPPAAVTWDRFIGRDGVGVEAGSAGGAGGIGSVDDVSVILSFPSKVVEAM